MIRSLSQGLLPTRRKRESVDVSEAPSMTACVRNSEYEATTPGGYSEYGVSCVRDSLQVGSKLLDRCVADSRNPSKTYLLTQSGNEGQKQLARCRYANLSLNLHGSFLPLSIHLPRRVTLLSTNSQLIRSSVVNVVRTKNFIVWMIPAPLY